VSYPAVATKVFDGMSGGGEHCQTGNLTLVRATIIDGLAETFT